MGALQLAIACMWMNGFQRFFNIGQRFLEDLAASDSPGVTYFHIAKREFKGVPFGDPGTGRISSSNMTAEKFEKIFLQPDGTSNGNLEKMAKALQRMGGWVNETTRTKNFNHFAIQQRVRQCCAELRRCCEKELLQLKKPMTRDVNIGKFRLMMDLQIMALSKLVIIGHKDLNNMVYPVKGLGADAQLAHVQEADRPMVLFFIISKNGWEYLGLNAGEGTLCEPSIYRVDKIFDIIFRGMLLFRVMEDGANSLKKFGSSLWEMF